MPAHLNAVSRLWNWGKVKTSTLWKLCTTLMPKLSDSSIEKEWGSPSGVQAPGRCGAVGPVPIQWQQSGHKSSVQLSSWPCLSKYSILHTQRPVQSNKQRYGTIAIRNIHETAAMEMILLFEKFIAFSRPIVSKIMATTVSVFMESKYLAVLVTRSQTGREEGEDKKVLIINFLIINNIFYTF